MHWISYFYKPEIIGNHTLLSWRSYFLLRWVLTWLVSQKTIINNQCWEFLKFLTCKGRWFTGVNPGDVFDNALTVYRQQASNLDPGVADIQVAYYQIRHQESPLFYTIDNWMNLFKIIKKNRKIYFQWLLYMNSM